MNSYLVAATAALSIVASQPAWADATQLDPATLSGGDPTDFSTYVDSGFIGGTAMTVGGMQVQLVEINPDGSFFSDYGQIFLGDTSGSTSAFDNVVLTLDLTDSNTVEFAVSTDGFSKAFYFPIELTAGVNTIAFGAIDGETLSDIEIVPGAGSATLTGLTFNLTSDVTSGVPEPGTWAMMLLGFGAVGMGMRLTRKSSSMRQIA